MLRSMRGVENQEPTLAADTLHRRRWASIGLDTRRSLVPDDLLYCGEFNCVDIDSSRGELLLLGGKALGSTPCEMGVIAVFSLPTNVPISHLIPSESDSLASRIAPRAWSTCDDTPGIATIIEWFPNEVALFLLGSSSGAVYVWDTATFQPCLQFCVNDINGEGNATVNALHMSPAAGSRFGLVSVASSASDLKLFDINSNSFTHSLKGHDSSITDAHWSPSNPYLLATSGTDRRACLFDIRKSGKFACLCIFDQSKALLKGNQNARRLEHHPQIRARNVPEVLVPGCHPGVSLHEKMMTLAEASREAADKFDMSPMQRNPGVSRNRSTKSRDLISHSRGLKRIRFTKDGRHVLTGGVDGHFKKWDSITTHCILDIKTSSHEFLSSFEVSADPSIVVSRSMQFLVCRDLHRGRVLFNGPSPCGRIACLAAHPWREEVYCVSGSGQISCWSSDVDMGNE